MSNQSAIRARARISFVVWMDRVEQLLAAAGFRVRQFPNIAWERLYREESRPLQVVEALLEMVVASQSEKWN